MARYLRHEDYSIAWICAISVEVHAAMSILDERHTGLFPRKDGDDNVYEAGRIGPYNIVIASLPEQRTGNVASATLMTQLKTSFRKLQYAFMVGIGGGVPGPNGLDPDIRLGDVVIAYPTDKSSGVENYELGKETRDGFLKRLDNSFRMDPVLENTIRSMKLHSEQSGTIQFLEHLKIMPSQIIGKRKLGEETPRNIELHTMGATTYPVRNGYEDVLLDDQTGQTIIRTPRVEPEKPKVHYGAIASGDKVVKTAKQREHLRKTYGVLCIEMEAAGLRNSYPAAIIRGISDYSDGSKNDAWHTYASVAAAAYAKSVILRIPPSIDHIRSQEPTTETNSNVINEDREACMASLLFENIDARLTSIKAAHATTCTWVYEQPEYKNWLNESLISRHHGFLWIKGKPGAGKSTIMKHAFKSKTMLSDATVMSFFFNARGSILEKSVLGMYRSLTHQLLEAVPYLQDNLTSMYLRKQRTDSDSDWTTCELQDFLQQAIGQVQSRTRIVWFIDALDECKENEVREMVEFLESLGETAAAHRTSLNICLASRHYPHISIQTCLELIVENVEGHEKDIQKYVQSKFNASKNKTMDAIREELLRKASGVFLWVVLVVQILNEEYDHGRRHHLRAKLDELPSKLDDLFADILSRDSSTMAETTLCLQWLLFSKRPLKRQELYFAVLSISDPAALEDWDPEEIESNNETIQNFILSCSKGLAEVSKGKYPTVQFIHETVRDFFLLKNGLARLDVHLKENVIGLSENKLKNCCALYLKIHRVYHFVDLPLPVATSEDAKKLRASVDIRLPFLDYAVRYIFQHADVAQKHNISQKNFLSTFAPDGLEFPNWRELNNLMERYEVRRYSQNLQLLYLLSEQNLIYLTKVLLQNTKNLDLDFQGERYGSAIQVACYNGNVAVVQLLSKAGANVHISRDECRSPLLVAIEKRNIPIVQTLLDNGADQTVKFKNGLTPLMWAVEHRFLDVIKALLADPQAPVWTFNTSIHQAIAEGSGATLKLLLSDQRINVNAQNLRGYTPLHEAIRCGSIKMIKMLLANPRINPTYRDFDGNTPLHHACKSQLQCGTDSPCPIQDQDYDSMLVVKLLLGDPRVSPGCKNKAGDTALHEALRHESTDVIMLLLADARVDPQCYDDAGNTPLHEAAWRRSSDIVTLLLADPRVNPQCVNNDGNTPLHKAAWRRSSNVVKLLLADSRVNPQCANKSGDTPLQMAAWQGSSEIVNFLLEDTRINPQCANNSGDTPLHKAAWQGFSDIVKLLLADPRVDPQSQNDHGKAPFHCAVLAKFSEKSLRTMGVLLESSKVDPNCRDNTGRTPLHHVASLNHLRKAATLLKSSRVDPNLRDDTGKTPLDLAFESSLHIAKLIQADARVI